MGGSAGYSAPKANPQDISGQGYAAQALQNYVAGQSSGAASDLINKYAMGQLGLDQVLSGINGLKGPSQSPVQTVTKNRDMTPAELSAYMDTGVMPDLRQTETVSNSSSASPYNSGSLAQAGAYSSLLNNPITGTKLAQDQVLADPTLAGLYGQGGLQSQAIDQYGTASNNLTSDREALLGRDQSYGLTDQDLKAYGQAATNITNMYGGMEKSLAQSLASRGLAQPGTGVGVPLYSGLKGNQFEQLAQQQQQIAQNRINSAMDLAKTRANVSLQQQQQAGTLAGNLGQLGQSAIQNQYNRNQSGVQNYLNNLGIASNQNLQNTQFQQEQNNEALQQQQQTKEPSLFESVLGLGASAFTGGLAGGLGKGVSSSIFGTNKPSVR